MNPIYIQLKMSYFFLFKGIDIKIVKIRGGFFFNILPKDTSWSVFGRKINYQLGGNVKKKIDISEGSLSDGWNEWNSRNMAKFIGAVYNFSYDLQKIM